MKLFYRFLFTAIAVFLLSATVMNNPERGKFVKSTDTTISSVKDSLLVLEQQQFKLAEGKKLYEARCQKCHVLYQPGQFRLKKWVRNLEEMKHKAELKKDEYDLILEYISANCKK